MIRLEDESSPQFATMAVYRLPREMNADTPS